MKSVFKLVLLAILLSLCMATNAKPMRIVSLAPSITKCIYQLGAEENLIGCTSYCEIEKNSNISIVASAIQVYIEKVIALKPDVVLTTPLTDSETIKTLHNFGIEVKVIPSATTFLSLCDQFLQLGEMVGKQKQALKIVSDCKIRMEQLELNFKNDRIRKMFFQIGAQPLFTVLPNTFMNDYITFASGENIAKNMKSGTITRESVIVADPEIIFIVTMGIVGNEEKEIWESYRYLSASKNKQVFILDSDLSCTPTPITFVQTFEIITNLLKPNHR